MSSSRPLNTSFKVRLSFLVSSRPLYQHDSQLLVELWVTFVANLFLLTGERESIDHTKDTTNRRIDYSIKYTPCFLRREAV